MPDTINASLRYPEGFLVSLSGTFGNQRGGSGPMRIMGTEGTLVMGSSLRFIPEIVYESNQWVVESWPEALQDAYYSDPKNRHEEMPSTRPSGVVPGEEEYRAEGEGSLKVHIAEFLAAIKEGTPTIEDAMVGHHAAACAHMINLSLDREEVVHWDANRHTLASE